MAGLTTPCTRTMPLRGIAGDVESLGAFMTWEQFKRETEKIWLNTQVRANLYGYQIQPGTKWNPGMSLEEIQDFESILGFPLPHDYRQFLQHMNGFDRPGVNVFGGEGTPSLIRQCYRHPHDFQEAAWLCLEIEAHRSFVNEALEDGGFNPSGVVGFVPIYGHRALAVFRDQSLSPVLSVVGADVIVYGPSLMEYLMAEFGLPRQDEPIHG